MMQFRKIIKRHDGKRCTSGRWRKDWKEDIGIPTMSSSNNCVSADEYIDSRTVASIKCTLRNAWRWILNDNNTGLADILGLCYDNAHLCPVDEETTFSNKVSRLDDMYKNRKNYPQIEDICTWFLDLIEVDY